MLSVLLGHEVFTLTQLIRKSVLTLVLGDYFQIIIVFRVDSSEARLRVHAKESFTSFFNKSIAFKSVLVDVREVTLVHDLSYCVLF